MVSKTKSATLYNVELGDLKIGIIDTPGFGDSRGMAKDQEHSACIVNALKDEEYINCICLIINGRMTRISATLKYVLNEITAILPNTVLENVIVVFTNTADSLDLYLEPGLLAEQFLGKEIDPTRLFFVENPYCRLERAKERRNDLPHEMIVQSLQRSFGKARKTFGNMREVIRSMDPIYTHFFVTLYEKRRDIDRKVKDLSTEYDNIEQVEKSIEKAEFDAKVAMDKKKLTKDYRFVQTAKRWIRKPTAQHNLVCSASSCHSNCQMPCFLPKSLSPSVFLSCACMNGEYCRVCGHHYTLHYHDEVENVLQEETITHIDEHMKRQFEEAASAEERAQILKKEFDAKRKDILETKKTLSLQLLHTIEEFQELGLTRNYAIVLESQLVLVEHRLAGAQGEQTKDLRKTKEKIEKKLRIVRDTLRGK